MLASIANEMDQTPPHFMTSCLRFSIPIPISSFPLFVLCTRVTDRSWLSSAFGSSMKDVLLLLSIIFRGMLSAEVLINAGKEQSGAVIFA
jgi:hypothetical protein